MSVSRKSRWCATRISTCLVIVMCLLGRSWFASLSSSFFGVFLLPFSYRRSSGFFESNVSSLLFMFCFAFSCSMIVVGVLFCISLFPFSPSQGRNGSLFCLVLLCFKCRVGCFVCSTFAPFRSSRQEKRVGCVLFCFVLVAFRFPRSMVGFLTCFMSSPMPRWLFLFVLFLQPSLLSCWLFCFVLFYLDCCVSYSVCFVLCCKFLVQ